MTDDQTISELGTKTTDKTVVTPNAQDDETVLRDGTDSQAEDRTVLAPASHDDETVLRDGTDSQAVDKTILAPAAQDDETVLRDGADSQAADKTILAPAAVGDETVLREGADTTAASTLAVGALIKDRFRITAVLGVGGMGTVYQALDLRKEEASDSDPHVAIKVLSGALAAHTQSFIMLQRESRKSQQLAHPNIITVFDFDRDDDLVYMTMEQLNGKPLDEVISENPTGVDPELLEGILNGITAGLEYAHSKRIIHSDLKPSNIFLLDSGVVKILDFGIARAASDSSATGDETVFDAGELGGLTPTYASVEMFQGQDPSPGDDIYALGLIAYELATGKHPYGRRPANQVPAEGKAPGKPDVLGPRQWRAVKSAIAVDKDQRLPDIHEFRRLYFGKSRWLTATAVVLLLVAVTAAATRYLSPEAELAAVPFETLPADVQETITAQLEMADESLSFKDYNAALFHLERVNELHTNNPEARRMAAEIVDDVLVPDGEATPEDLKNKVENLLMYDVMLSNERLMELKESMEAEP